MIKVSGFSKKFDKNSSFVVKNINFNLSKGITGLLALNGQGKTTILKSIASLYYPSEGKISVSDKNGIFFDTSFQSDLAKLNTGYVPETLNLPSSYTVYEYLSVISDIFNIENKNEKIKEICKKCLLDEVSDKKIGKLSKGYKQRTALAGAIIHDPQNLILDESISGLDAKQIILYRKLLKELAQEKTILISTHIMQEVHSLCDNILILHDKNIIFTGTEDDLLKKTSEVSIEEAFLKITGQINEK